VSIPCAPTRSVGRGTGTHEDGCTRGPSVWHGCRILYTDCSALALPSPDASQSRPALPSSTPVTLLALPSSTPVTRRCGAALVGASHLLCEHRVPHNVSCNPSFFIMRREGGRNSWNRRASCQTRRRFEVRRTCRRAPAGDLRVMISVTPRNRVQELQVRSGNDAGSRSSRTLTQVLPYHVLRVHGGRDPHLGGPIGRARPRSSCSMHAYVKPRPHNQHTRIPDPTHPTHALQHAPLLEQHLGEQTERTAVCSKMQVCCNVCPEK